jgi:hypothetical protein
VSEHEATFSPEHASPHTPVGDAPSVLDLELQALAYEAALRYGARQVPKPLVEFLRPEG